MPMTNRDNAISRRRQKAFPLFAEKKETLSSLVIKRKYEMTLEQTIHFFRSVDKNNHRINFRRVKISLRLGPDAKLARAQTTHVR